MLRWYFRYFYLSQIKYIIKINFTSSVSFLMWLLENCKLYSWLALYFQWTTLVYSEVIRLLVTSRMHSQQNGSNTDFESMESRMTMGFCLSNLEAGVDILKIKMRRVEGAGLKRNLINCQMCEAQNIMNRKSEKTRLIGAHF